MRIAKILVFSTITILKIANFEKTYLKIGVFCNTFVKTFQSRKSRT